MFARVLNAVLMVLVGVIFGLIGTVAHQSVITIGSTTLPWGLVASVLTVTCLLIGVRLLSTGRLHTFLAAIGVLVPIGVFSMASAGGSVLIPANAWGTSWIVAVPIVAAIVIAWPSLRRVTNGHTPAGSGVDTAAANPHA